MRGQWRYLRWFDDGGVGGDASIGTVGDAYDNASPKSVIGLYKSELINPQRPWKPAEEVEIATLHYVDWFNNHRLYRRTAASHRSNWSRPTTVNTGP